MTNSASNHNKLTEAYDSLNSRQQAYALGWMLSAIANNDTVTEDVMRGMEHAAKSQPMYTAPCKHGSKWLTCAACHA